MSAKPCNCGDPVGHAKAVEDAVFRSIFRALDRPEEEARCFAHAQKLEDKFITQHGRHYGAILQAVMS